MNILNRGKDYVIHFFSTVEAIFIFKWPKARFIAVSGIKALIIFIFKKRRRELFFVLIVRFMYPK